MNKYYKETITIVPSDLQSGGAEGAHLQCAVDYKSTGTLPKAKMTARMATFIFHLSTFIFLSACTENSFTEEFSQQTNALHITSVTIDGQDVARTRVVADEGAVQGIPYNQSFNGFSEGDALQLVITNATPSTAYAIYNADGTWSISSDKESIIPVTIVPDKANSKKWTDVGIEAAFGGEQIAGEVYPIATQGMGIVQGDIPVTSSIIYSDWLVASTSAGTVTIDTDVKSPTLGATTIALKHVHALLRLPKSAVTIEAGTYITAGTSYTLDANSLGTLWAVVKIGDDTQYCPLTAVTIDGTDYLQAIVPADNDGAYTLTGFKAVMKVAESSTLTLDLPFKVGENETHDADGIALQPNTRYPLTLTIAPHRATVSLTSAMGKPGWSTEGEEELSNEMNEALVIDGANATDVDAVKAEIEAAIAKGVSTIVVTGTTLAAYSNGTAKSVVGEAIRLLTEGTNVSLVLPDATSIAQSAFTLCKALASVSAPEATVIHTAAFGGCTSLASVEFPNANTIMASAFGDCAALTSVEFPLVNQIGNQAFNGCTALTSLTFGEVITSVDNNAFLNFTTKNCALTLNSGQQSSENLAPNGYKWAGYTWESISYVDNEGNAVEGN